jgi:glycogen debranching enzyme
MYFGGKSCQPKPRPRFADTRDLLPAPIYDEQPEWVRMYWRAWELAFSNFHEPAPGSGFVTPFIDAAFNQNIFLWDTAFMTLFCNVAHGLVPGIGSLDNFYARQHAGGEICREINRLTGAEYPEWCNSERQPLFSRWGWNWQQPGLPEERDVPVTYRGRAVPQPPPVLTLDALNHPIPAWAEMESFRMTGDQQRLADVYPALVRYHNAFAHYLRQGNGLYVTDWASMDNSPRNPLLRGGGCAIDTSSQMGLFARNLATMADLLGLRAEAADWQRQAIELATAINRHLWDDRRGFYFDLKSDGTRTTVKTIAAFWTLLAGVAEGEQVDAIVAQLGNPATFNRVHRVPTLAADEPGYDKAGGYWRGAVWAPTTTMVIRGLEQCGRPALAREIALNHLGNLGLVFTATGTIWENYAPDAVAPGEPAKGDFVGWSGLGPILYLLEYAIGLKPDAPRHALHWDLRSPLRCGCARYRCNGRVVSLLASPVSGPAGERRITIEADGPLALTIAQGNVRCTYAVGAGRREFDFPAAQV